MTKSLDYCKNPWIPGSDPKSLDNPGKPWMVGKYAHRTLDISTIVLPRVTRDLPVHLVPFRTHHMDLPLAAPTFG